MATKSKTSTKKTNAKDSLAQEKEEQLNVKAIVKDERTLKIVGFALLVLALLLFVAFGSYLFTWDEDQDKVVKNGIRLFWGTEDKVSNMLGTLGAFLGHFFFFQGFGIASIMFCSFFFVLGINIFTQKKIFSIKRNIKYLLIGVPLISVCAAVFFESSPFAWGGTFGNNLRDFLKAIVGTIGTYAIIVVALFSYVVWRFNPSFNFSKLMNSGAEKDLPKAADNNGATAEEMLEDINEEDQKEEGSKSLNGNYLNENAALLPIEPTAHNSAVEFEVIEKKQDEMPIITASTNSDIAITTLQQSNDDVDDDTGIHIEMPHLAEMETVVPSPKTKQEIPANLELEIKTAPEDEEEEELEELPTKMASREPYDPILDLRDYKYPSVDLLENHGSEKIVQDPAELERYKNQIIDTLKNYDIQIQKISATVGPTVTLYEIIPAAGVRISRIKNLEDDIALSLAALGIRIIAPIPGKGTIGIEVPNAKKTVVSMKTLLSSEKFQSNNFSLPIAIGKKIDNENFIVDLASMPHLLMAGATGQGKSVGLNAILVSLLYKKHPSQLKFVLVDPKKVELSIYRTIEKHFLAKLPGEDESIITDTKKVIHTLNALCIEMDNRYDLLKEAGVRNIKEYNEKFTSRKLNPDKGHQYLPFIVLVVDEFADLIMTAGKEVEMPIARLAQLARAVGIHLIIATQRPSVNIITGTIKANFPARIAFKVSSKIDSRTILDTGGAEQLIGKGDMLISYNGEVVRLQCAFVDTPEVDKITDFIGEQRGYPQAFLLPEYVDEKEMEGKDFDLSDKDSLFNDAARLIVATQSGSTSLIQRKMKLGYNRAGRLMDQLEAAGIVGKAQGSKPRDVLIHTEADLQLILDII